MADKSVLILGATSDVAKQLAYQYASQGYKVVLTGRDIVSTDRLAKDINIRYETGCEAHELDILDFESHKRVLEAIKEIPDTSICFVGYLGDHAKALNDWEESSNILNTNYVGVISVLNLIAAQYEKNGKGSIAVLSSVAGDRGRQSNYLYGSAKSGLTTFLSGLRNRLASKSIHVLTVKPGFIATKMTAELDLPKLLTASATQVAKAVIVGLEKKKNVIYVRWFWRYIMLIIKLIPESVFKKLSL